MLAPGAFSLEIQSSRSRGFDSHAETRKRGEIVKSHQS